VGTLSEWMRVLGAGAIFGLLMFLADRPSSGKLSRLAVLVLSGLLFGMMMVFRWRVLHWAIVVVFAIAVLGLFAIRLVEWRTRKRADSRL
jgi:dolichyl-phosphate-mannose--protein O-mannosyl transferase